MRRRSRGIATALTVALIATATVVFGPTSASAAPPPNQTTELVSYGPNGENSRGDHTTISRDGSTVMFSGPISEHLPEIEPVDEFDRAFFLRDLDTNELIVVAEGIDGLPPTDYINSTAMAADGQHVAFSSQATNLTTTPTNGNAQVYLWDRSTGENKLVSVSTTGTSGGDEWSYETSVSADGRYVVFASMASDLIAGDTNGARDLFIRDMQLGVTTRLLEDIEVNYFQFELSGDGETLVFSTSVPYVAGDTNGVHDLYVLDLATSAIELASVAANGAPGAGVDDLFMQFSISYDGTAIAFSSMGSDFLAGDTNGVSDVFIRDLTTNTTTLASANLNGGWSNGHSSGATLSSDGRFVAFSSSATDIITPAASTFGSYYIRDLAEEETVWFGWGGEPQFGDSSWNYYSVADGGSLVSFMSWDGGLVNDDNVFRVYVRNMAPVITSGAAATDVPENAQYPGHTVTTTGSDRSFTPTFTVSSGSLPTGLSLNASTGAITGTPTADGTYNFTVTATTVAGSDSQPLTIKVLPTIVTVIDEPSIDGTPVVDGELTADPGEWDPANTAFTYQWQVDGVDVTGETDQTFSPRAADAGKDITVSVTGTAPSADPVSATSDPVGPVAKADLTTAVPVISDTTPTVGQTITVNGGTWQPTPVALSYQWFAEEVAISGATGTSLSLTEAHAGAQITVVVTGTKTGYNDASEESQPTAAVEVGDLASVVPTISGTAKVGTLLTASPGDWAPPGVELSFQWKADTTNVGTDSATYTPVAADVGKSITVEVTGLLDGYGEETEVSEPTPVVAKGDLSGTVDFTGTLMFGETLTASESGWNGAALGYEWFANGAATGTGGTYVLDAADIGKNITVQVTAVLAGYNNGVLLSDPQGPVVAAPMVPAVPTITDTTPEVGQVLSAIVGTWSPGGVEFAYQWLSNGSPIVGATNSTYAVTATDAGDRISVRITGTKTGHTTSSSTSDETAPVATVEINVERISGANRYAGAIAISQAAFPGTAPVVYVSTGTNYPDALSAAPAAVAEGAPLLLLPPGNIPGNILAEINRLDPEKIVVVGGTGVVSPTAFSQLQAIATTVRMSGSDRYATSRAVVAGAFDSADLAYVATGGNFPDALSASGAAGASGNPVVLVNGTSSQVDLATKNLLTSLGIGGSRIVGGSAVVSNGIQSSLQSVAPVTRLGGSNRYAVSVNVNRDAFESSEFVFLATGANFPDALAGAAWAGKANAPLYIVPGSCVPQDVLDDIDDLGATTVYLLGGTGVLTNGVMNLTACP